MHRTVRGWWDKSSIVGLILLAALAPHCGNLADVDCSSQVAPVCALNGQTYQNRCLASQDGEFTVMDGSCPPILCKQDPVCGIDEITYLSNCFAVLSGITIYVSGECPICNCQGLVCDGPVCGNDKVTYPTNCFAEKLGIKDYKAGPCP